jgi:multiple sugar transport system substrate-binding protein
MKKIISIILTAILLLSLTACHGSQEQKVFEIPESFDTSRNYEISF